MPHHLLRQWAKQFPAQTAAACVFGAIFGALGLLALACTTAGALYARDYYVELHATHQRLALQNVVQYKVAIDDLV